MVKHWLSVLCCALALAATFDAIHRIALIWNTQDIPDQFFSRTITADNVATQRECRRAGNHRICRYQAYLESENGQRYKVYMRPLLEKGLDRIYRIPEGSEVKVSTDGPHLYAFEIIDAKDQTVPVAQLPLSEFEEWRSNSLFSAVGFLILDGLIVLLLRRKVSSMSIDETRAFVKFTLAAGAILFGFLYFSASDLPQPEEMHKREIIFSHISRESDCPLVWPKHVRNTCDYTPYLVSTTGERWTFGHGYKLATLAVSMPASGTTLYLDTFKPGVYRIQKAPDWAKEQTKPMSSECNTRLVPVEDEGVVHWVCKGQRYHRPADHDQKKSAFYELANRKLSSSQETEKERRITVLSYDNIKDHHEILSQNKRFLTGALFFVIFIVAFSILLLRTFWPGKPDGSASR
ncbi:hypothetical protein [Marinobacter sp. HN1S83]|uniref:hypothetical protein n=1 Tax=Marinobacter sp. HN1S83 TaxID=3382301 RepID=UPI00387B9B7F